MTSYLRTIDTGLDAFRKRSVGKSCVHSIAARSRAKVPSPSVGSAFSPWPRVTDEEITAAVDVLKSNRVNYWTGQQGRVFEQEFAEWCGADHAVVVANGSVALELCWKALNIGPGDEVIVTSRSFLASASSIVLQGATPVFADVCRDSQNITPETVEHLITPQTKAILCVHLAGWPCDMAGFRSLADAYQLKLVEDCAQAHGAAIDGRLVGSWGDISAWSFCQDKIMSTGGEGGMVTTCSSDLWKKAWSYKDHGKTWDKIKDNSGSTEFRWLHDSEGTNWRLPEVQSAIGRCQLRSVDRWSAQRSGNAASILAAARRTTLFRAPTPGTEVQHAYYKCYVFVKREALKKQYSRTRVLQEILDMGVPCFTGSCSEMYLEKVFADRGIGPERRLEVARELGDTSLMFLVHPTLTAAEIELTVNAITTVGRRAVR